MENIAVIADIHGNSWALKAVLDDINSRKITKILNLGDSADADMDPNGTIELLMQHKIASIAGNYETFREDQLDLSQREWLSMLPKTMEYGEIFCCHGTPNSDHQELIEIIHDKKVEIADSELILERLDGIKHSLILCAHKHVPRTVLLPTGQLIVNPGSVGWPAYWNDKPGLHVMESGSPHARYAIISKQFNGWNVEHIAICYPWDKAAHRARASDREDRAIAIETGRMVIPDNL